LVGRLGYPYTKDIQTFFVFSGTDALGTIKKQYAVVSLVSIILSNCIVYFPKPGLLASFLVEAGSWTTNVGSLLVVTQEIDGEDAHRCMFRVSFLPPRPSALVCGCLGEFGDGGLLLGISNIRSLHCLLYMPGPLAGFLVEAGSWTASVGSLLVVTQDIDEEDAHRCTVRLSFLPPRFLPPRPALACGCLGEFGDDRRLLLVGLSNIEALLVLLPKPGLLAGLMLEAGYWTTSVGSLLLVHSRSPSQRFFFSFVSFFKNVGAWKSFIPIARRFMFSRLSEGNLEASWSMDTLATSTLSTMPARRSARKGERLLLASIEVFMFSRLSECRDLEASWWTTDTLATSMLPITPGRRSGRKKERLLESIDVSLYEC
jgi:hypothetical protein